MESEKTLAARLHIWLILLTNPYYAVKPIKILLVTDGTVKQNVLATNSFFPFAINREIKHRVYGKLKFEMSR